ncbi:MAG: hypothetical protein AAGA48_21685 [Myxococcota bacterium]
MAAALRDLPLARWASRFVEGTVQISGRLPRAIEPSFDGVPTPIGIGLVRVALNFIGGETPAFAEGTVVGPRCNLTTADGLGVAAVVDALHDVGLCVEARTDGELQVSLGHGIEASVPAEGVVTLSAVVEGPPDAVVLATAVEVSVAGQGIGVRHQQARWLDGLARIRIRRVSLHPNGEVELDGSGAGVMDWAVTNGLRRASSRITELVRDSPRFERLRAFLRLDSPGGTPSPA